MGYCGKHGKGYDGPACPYCAQQGGAKPSIWKRLFGAKPGAETKAPERAAVTPGLDDAYLSGCLAKKYQEEAESRTWNSDPAFRSVLDPLNNGDNARACSAAEGLAVMHADLALVYLWWGKALLRMREFDKARILLASALEKCKQKFALCNLLGEAEWKKRNLREAVYWWAQGMHCQESLSESNYGDDEGAYLYLHYVAGGRGLGDCASAFLTRVDEIRPGRIRFNAETGNDLLGLSRAANDGTIAEVLRRLVGTYITPPPKPATGGNSAEVARLIRQLEKVMQEQYGMGDMADVEAAKRLGELGDPQAIGILTRVGNGARLIELMFAAKDAVESIKKANG
jgi:tetratricopeptide (TPR) repeat protein